MTGRKAEMNIQSIRLFRACVRHLAGWFGVRGIGSMYYLMYAIQHGLPEETALELIHLTLIVVALSILVHGVSVKPTIARYWRMRKPKRNPHLGN